MNRCPDDQHTWIYVTTWVDEVGADWWTYECTRCGLTEHREGNSPREELQPAREREEQS